MTLAECHIRARVRSEDIGQFYCGLRSSGSFCDSKATAGADRKAITRGKAPRAVRRCAQGFYVAVETATHKMKRGSSLRARMRALKRRKCRSLDSLARDDNKRETSNPRERREG